MLYALLCTMHYYALCTRCSLRYALCSMHYALFSIHNALTLRRSQVSRRLDLLFAGGSKLHYCHSKDHKVASLETRGRHPRLSTGICPRKLSLLSRLFLRQYPPLVQLVACQLGIIYCGVGGGHSKYTPSIIHYKFTNTNTHPRSYITNSGRRGIYRTQRNRKRHSSVLQNPLLIVSSIIYRQAG